MNINIIFKIYMAMSSFFLNVDATFSRLKSWRVCRWRQFFIYNKYAIYRNYLLRWKIEKCFFFLKRFLNFNVKQNKYLNEMKIRNHNPIFPLLVLVIKLFLLQKISIFDHPKKTTFLNYVSIIISFNIICILHIT